MQKVVESIQSRLHIVQIPSPTQLQIRGRMEHIISTEAIEIDDDSKEYILSISNMSIRSMIGLLEKMYIFNDKVTKDKCIKLCSVVSYSNFDDYVEELQQNNLNKAIRIMYNLYDYGYSVIDIYDYLFLYIKTQSNLCDDMKYKITKILCKYITIFNMIHEDCIELALFTGNIIELFHPSKTG